jgi:4'-phosphopantetheinyl transferase
VVGVARGRDLGIDVELLRPLNDALAVAERFFCAAERTKMRGAEGADQVQTFLNYWTRKEAILKATGGGLSLPLDCVDVGWSGAESPQLIHVRDVAGAARGFRVLDLSPARGYIGAIAVEGEGWQLTAQQWPEDIGEVLSPPTARGSTTGRY